VILKKEKPKAAKWWKENGFPESNQFFCFEKTEVKILKEVDEHLEMIDDMDHPFQYLERQKVGGNK
jgi:hypothetical protein